MRNGRTFENRNREREIKKGNGHLDRGKGGSVG